MFSDKNTRIVYTEHHTQTDPLSPGGFLRNLTSMPDPHTLSQFSEVIVCYFYDQKHDIVKTDWVRPTNSLPRSGPSCLPPTLLI